jgi:hypothetical protein
MDGTDVEEAHRSGLVSRQQMVSLTRDSAETLRKLGWCVLDHKPRHLILRQNRKSGRLLTRNHRMVLGLVDYELLYPAEV